MKTLLLVAAIFTVSMGSPIGQLRAAPPTDAPSPNQSWIYYRHLNLYIDLLTDTNLPPVEQRRFRQQAYDFFFRYWILHRSKYAQLPPQRDFERDFALLLRKYDLPFVDQSDPLGIKSRYKDGKYVPKPLPKVPPDIEVTVPESVRLPHVDGVPSEEFKTLKSYQELVHGFQDFMSSSLAKRER